MEGRGTVPNCTKRRRTIPKKAVSILRTIQICIVDLLRGGLAVALSVKITFATEGEENFVGDSEIIALGGASNETKDRPLG